MKHGKVLTRKEKELLTSNGLNAKDYLRIKRLGTSIEVVNINNGETKVIPYERK